MKAFVFKPNNAFIGKFDVSSIEELPEAIINFEKRHSILAFDYIECSGQTWTLTNGSLGLELVEGRVYGGQEDKLADDSGLLEPILDATARYENGYFAANSMISLSVAVKFLGMFVGLIFVIFGMMEGSKSGVIFFCRQLLNGMIYGAILYTVGVFVFAVG